VNHSCLPNVWSPGLPTERYGFLGPWKNRGFPRKRSENSGCHYGLSLDFVPGLNFLGLG
jgi:hypothetical protein